MLINSNRYRADILLAISDALSENTNALDHLNNSRLRSDDDCGVCQEILILRGRSEGVLRLEAILRDRGIL